MPASVEQQGMIVEKYPTVKETQRKEHKCVPQMPSANLPCREMIHLRGGERFCVPYLGDSR